MSEFTPEQTLAFVALSLQKESDHELAEHLEHDCYAGALVMQDLILVLYPEVTVPTQRTASEVREVA